MGRPKKEKNDVLNEKIAKAFGFIKTEHVPYKDATGTQYCDIWVHEDDYMSVQLPDFSGNFKLLYKFIIPQLPLWSMQSNGAGMVTARIVDKEGSIYDEIGEKPALALCLAIQKYIEKVG
jgi:hypothetical protein